MEDSPSSTIVLENPQLKHRLPPQQVDQLSYSEILALTQQRGTTETTTPTAEISTVSDKQIATGGLRRIAGFLSRRNKTEGEVENQEPVAEAKVEAPPVDEFISALERLDVNKEKLAELGIRPREALSSDHDHIENQTIDIIDARDIGGLVASFKLTSGTYDKVIKALGRREEEADETVARNAITYLSTQGGDSFEISRAYEIKDGDVTVKVAIPDHNYFGREKQSSLGLVNIEIPLGDSKDPSALEDRINQILERTLGIEQALKPPTPEAVSEYKQARYIWHHKLSADQLTDEQRQSIENLSRQEVFAGYRTMVDEGKHKEYQEKFGEIVLVHNLYSAQNLINVIKAGGLMASHERFRRGLITNGMSSVKDFETGGADSVFTRAFARSALESHGLLDERTGSEALLILNPKVMDRTDWYVYTSDEFGATDEVTFKTRLSPEDFFKEQESNVSQNNEQMFRTGISIADVEGVLCEKNSGVERSIRHQIQDSGQNISQEELDELFESGPDAVIEGLASHGITTVYVWGEEISVSECLAADTRMSLLVKCKESGITEINGIPIDKFISYGTTFRDALDKAHGRKPGESQKKEEV